MPDHEEDALDLLKRGRTDRQIVKSLAADGCLNPGAILAQVKADLVATVGGDVKEKADIDRAIAEMELQEAKNMMMKYVKSLVDWKPDPARPKARRPDPSPMCKALLKCFEQLHQVQRLTGPKNLVQVAFGVNTGGATGPTPLQGMPEDRLVEEARRKGLPIPADLEFRRVADEAGKRGETLLITKEDADNLRGRK